MNRGGTFASIDVGTTKIVTVVGEVTHEGDTRILGVGVAPADGLSRGMVENIRDATDAIRTSVDKAEKSSGTRILSAHVGIAGQHIACLNNRGIIAIPDRQRPIMPDDVVRVLDGARVVSIPTNREILHVIPRYYVVDGQDHISDPVGMYGTRLDVETHIVTGIDVGAQSVKFALVEVGFRVAGAEDFAKVLVDRDIVVNDQDSTVLATCAMIRIHTALARALLAVPLRRRGTQ